MDFFSKLGETLSGAGRDVSKKAKDLTESTKMDIDIRTKESYINKQYTSMGKKYFEMHENDEEPLFEEIELIREAKAEIQRMRDLLAEKKGMKKCVNCQSVIPQDVVFCPHCGTKCETPAAQETVTEPQEEMGEKAVTEPQEEPTVMEPQEEPTVTEPREGMAEEVQDKGAPAQEMQPEEGSGEPAAEEVQYKDMP